MASRWLAVLASCAAMFAAGCTADAEGEESTSGLTIEDIAATAKSLGFTEQYDALSDGDVTASEYEEAIARFKACVTEQGLRVTNETLNKGDSLTILLSVHYGSLPDSEGIDIEIGCREENLSYVQSGYLVTNDAILDAAAMAMTLECLSGQGIDVEGDPLNVESLYEAVSDDQAGAVKQCVGDALWALYPDEMVSFPQPPKS